MVGEEGCVGGRARSRTCFPGGRQRRRQRYPHRVDGQPQQWDVECLLPGERRWRQDLVRGEDAFYLRSGLQLYRDERIQLPIWGLFLNERRPERRVPLGL